MTNATFPNGYALLIGVGADLAVTVKDATALRDVLIDCDNFPLCYYAGGSKFLPGEAATIETRPISLDLTAGQRRRSQQKLDTLQADWNILTEKVKQMLEQQLLDEVDQLESVLQ
jgi:hypothetical protein